MLGVWVCLGTGIWLSLPLIVDFFFLSPKVSFSSFILSIHQDTFAPLGMLKVTLGVKVCSYSPWIRCAGKCCSTWQQPGEVCVKGDGFIEQAQHLEETAMLCWILNNSHWLESIRQNFHNFNPFLTLLASRWSGFPLCFTSLPLSLGIDRGEGREPFP